MPAIHMEKQLGWASKLGGVESLGSSKAGQTVLARWMGSQMWQLTGFCGGGFRKGTMASAHLDARHFSFSLYTIGAFQAATLLLELRGGESEKVNLYVGSSGESAGGSNSSFHDYFLQPDVVGICLPGTGSLAWASGVGLGLHS